MTEKNVETPKEPQAPPPMASLTAGKPDPKPRQYGCLWMASMGCLGMLGVVLLAGVILWQSRKRLVAGGMGLVAAAAVEHAGLSSKQQGALIRQIQRLLDAYTNDRITRQDMVVLIGELGEGPWLPAGAMRFQMGRYIAASDWSDARKKKAIRLVERLSRGLIEGSILLEKTKAIFTQMQSSRFREQEQVSQFKERLTEKELEALLETIEQWVEDAGIPDEAYEVDVAAHLKKAIDNLPHLVGDAPRTP